MPTITFQAAIILALGLYLEIRKPDARIPSAEKTNATAPVIKLQRKWTEYFKI